MGTFGNLQINDEMDDERRWLFWQKHRPQIAATLVELNIEIFGGKLSLMDNMDELPKYPIPVEYPELLTPYLALRDKKYFFVVCPEAGAENDTMRLYYGLGQRAWLFRHIQPHFLERDLRRAVEKIMQER